MIPLLPPLVEFMDPMSLYHYSGTSKTLRKEVRDTKAWALLARAQLPRSNPRDAASLALSQVKSYVRRRLLADALSQDTPTPLAFRPNRIEEFTFFVRFEEDGRMIWEGDLKVEPDLYVSFDLRPVWNAIKRARSWVSMERLFTNSASFTDFGDYLNGRVKITVVAIRDADDAMVSLGQFIFCNSMVMRNDGPVEVEYGFKSRTALFSSARFSLRLWANLVMVHDANFFDPTLRDPNVTQDVAEGHGCVKALKLKLEHYSELAVRRQDPHGYVNRLYGELEHLLSYLAGIHHLARAPALATIESWHVESFRHLLEGVELEGPLARPRLGPRLL